jgi:protein-tyrosine phosphatase
VWLNKLFGKKEEKGGGSPGIPADMHSHILYGIDDGAQEPADSIAMARTFLALGYKKVIATPHILWEMYPNTPEIIRGRLQELRQILKGEGIGLEVDAAAEYYIDENFVERLKAKEPLLTFGGNKVLVEISTVSAPFEFQEVLFEMQLQQYVPVIAHPERYIYLRNSKQVFDELKNAGCLFQLNILALGGHYGSGVQGLAEYLAKMDYYDFAGTDAHHVHHLEGLRRACAHPAYQKLAASGRLLNGQL